MKILIAAFLAVALLSVSVAAQDRRMMEEPSEEMEEPVHEDLDAVTALRDQDNDDEDQADEVASPQAKLRKASVPPTSSPPSGGVRSRRRRVRRRPTDLHRELQRFLKLYWRLKKRYGFRIHRYLLRLRLQRYRRNHRRFKWHHRKFHGRHRKFPRHRFHHAVNATASPTPASS